MAIIKIIMNKTKFKMNIIIVNNLLERETIRITVGLKNNFKIEIKINLEKMKYINMKITHIYKIKGT
jgi:hypothetical protein